MLKIRPLDVNHNRAGFDCGVAALNDFLCKTARQHREKGLSNTFVLLESENAHDILGFFTLSFLEVDYFSIPEKYSRPLPKSSHLPAAKLARLAVDKHCQGKGYGAVLLADAIKRVVSAASESGGVVGFFVDAKDEQARQFYLRFGFIPLQDTPMSLFLPLQTLLKELRSFGVLPDA